MNLATVGRTSMVIVAALLSSIASASPRLVVPNDTFDFGKRERGEIVEYTFVLRNDGDAPLVIKKVKPACGCTAAKLTDQLIPPAGEVPLAVKLNLARQNGPQIRAITIESNDPVNPKINLYLKGEAISRVIVKPERASFGRIDGTRVASTVVDVICTEGMLFNIRDVETSADNLRATVEVVEPGRFHRLQLQLFPPLNPGSFSGWVRFETDSKGEYSLLGVPVSAVVVGDAPLLISTDRIVLDADSGEASTHIISIGPGVQKEFAVTPVEPPSPEIAVRVRKVGTGYQIQLSNVDPASDLVGKTLVVRTDLEAMRKISIPFVDKELTGIGIPKHSARNSE